MATETDVRCPGPEELREYIKEPWPFHALYPEDFELQENGDIIVEVDTVRYHFEATYINVEQRPGEYKNIKNTYFEKTHAEAFEEGSDWQIEEDFISSYGFLPDGEGNPHKYDAYWVLDSITIQNTR